MATLAAPAIRRKSDTPVLIGLMVLYLFLVISRFIEFGAIVGIGAPPVLMVVTIVGVLAVVLSGGLLQAFSSTIGRLVLAFTFWLLITTGTSTWHLGSLQVLKGEWAHSLPMFLIVAGTVTTLDRVRTVAVVIGWSTALLGTLAVLLGTLENGRFGLTDGMVANSNLLAFHLLFGIPFCFYVIQESKWFAKVLMAGALLLSARVILATGSRSGLIMAAVLLIALLFRLSIADKIKLLLAGAAVVFFGLAFAPAGALERYRTLFSDEAGRARTSDYVSAEASSDSRTELLKESILLTLRNPIFGVGPGVFQSASADYEKSQNMFQIWRQTHNAYTQVSSETGIPGFVFFLCVLGSSAAALSRVQRVAKNTGNIHLGRLVFYVRLCQLVFVVGAFFTNVGYQFYFVLIAAVAVVLERSIAAPTVAIANPSNRVKTPTAAVRMSLPVTPAPSRRIGFGGYRRPRVGATPASGPNARGSFPQP